MDIWTVGIADKRSSLLRLSSAVIAAHICKYRSSCWADHGSESTIHIGRKRQEPRPGGKGMTTTVWPSDYTCILLPVVHIAEPWLWSHMRPEKAITSSRRQRPSATDASARLQPMSHFAPIFPQTNPQVFMQYPMGKCLASSCTVQLVCKE